MKKMGLRRNSLARHQQHTNMKSQLGQPRLIDQTWRWHQYFKIHSRGVLPLIVWSGIVTPVVATPVTAQMTVPSPVTSAVTSLPRATSAMEAVYHVAIKQALVRSPGTVVSFREARYPKDSLMRVASSEGATWLARLQSHPVQGIQHDAATKVGVWANRDDYANAQIAARLATPGLRLSDRAFTLYTAVSAFANENFPARLPIAEGYMAQLDALGDSVAYWQVAGHEALVRTYYCLGRSPDIARHGIRALLQFAAVPYIEREPGLITGIYLWTIEALSGLPEGRGQIEWLNRVLRDPSLTTPPPNVVALDSGFLQEGRGRRGRIEIGIKEAALLGQVGTPLVSNYWVNRPTTDSAVVPVTDGKIRLLEIFSYGCDGCVAALHGLQRIQGRFPTTVEAVATTFTMGVWANRFVSPDEEARRLHDYFVNNLKVSFPIAIWKWPKVQHEDGGYRLANNDAPGGSLWGSPNMLHYPLIVKPTIYLLDGHGRIRRIFMGGSREIEAQMLQAVEFLHREAQEHQANAR
jgi:hypothetical protein